MAFVTNYYKLMTFLSFFRRRTKALEAKGLLFVGSGVSGGEEGARFGPSLMPGGNPAAWPSIKPIFQAGWVSSLTVKSSSNVVFDFVWFYLSIPSVEH